MATSGRYSRLAGLLTVATVIIVVVLFGYLPGDSLLWRELQNTGHIPLFGLLAITLLFMWREWTGDSGAGSRVDYLVAGGASLVIGIAIEFGQVLTKHHDPSISDATHDLAGILIALGIYACIDSRMKPVWARQRPGLRRAVIILACSLLIVCLFPLLKLAAACRDRAAALPVIMDFTAGWATPFLELRHASLFTEGPAGAAPDAAGRRLAGLRMEPGIFPGVSIIEPYRDWTGYESLVLAIYSPEPSPVDLVLRVHDRAHNQNHSDRFTRQFSIQQGENRFRVRLAEIEAAPAGRNMNMSQIAGVILYATDISRPLTLYLEALRLE